ncbi:YqaA family protein [Burkholderia sp. D-99]|uniref:YqaA family protein n=1 Tax=Burkholderia sp. D-99 TaxID=2717316 RepID=UPI001422A953|nr:YqaA family protein [Burkholderia sp. D-99]NHV25343.1 DedA family protein [Burkholderia sp. D-99]
MSELLTDGGLFAVSMVAATLFPLQSEAVLAGLLLAGREPAWALVLVASIRNVAGSAINRALGRGTEHFRERRWLPVKPAALARAERWYARYGRRSLLLRWAPVIGDPLTVIADVPREPLPNFLAIVTIAKVDRYLAVAWLVTH